jgi:DNA-binding SARP family transcriptional activator/tetratricopeptide (TPR) repeat protein
MPGAMEFGLLGPLVVRSDGMERPVPRGHHRALLAALLLEANRAVPLELIIETLWGTAPPPSAPVAIRSYILRLRQALGDAESQRIRTEPHGYLIRVGAGELDLDRFEQLLAGARNAARGESWASAAAQARQALGLWRGEPLADIESETLALREIPRLAELRLQAAETRIEADLHRGGHAEVAAELQRLAVTHPLREHLHALLMLAFYRCDRQADALAAYRHVRTVLIEELGTEPGRELQKLHQRILAADPVLAAPRAQTAANAAGPGAAGGQRPAVPRQLPANVAGFTGRTAEMTALAQLLGRADQREPGTVVISAIGGTAGVGKTALAIHWAHQLAQRFADGQLYVNLRGFGPAGRPVGPAEAIRWFLDALGIPPDQIPRSPDAQAGLYRSLLAGKRMLIVLDNARDEQQVRPLLPASPGTLVIVTSRSQLAGLAAAEGARLLTLDVLTGAESTQLLIARIGADRADAEPEAVSEIARLCAHLPLALAIAAARGHARPHLPLAALAAELRDARRRLDALDTGDPAASVRAVFSWSFRQLSAPAARMFGLFSLHPGPDISGPAAASLAGCDQAQARQLLAELARAHLITEPAPGRHACHDLLRAYAGEQAHAADGDLGREAATGRMLDHYLHTAHAAALLLQPTRQPLTLAAARPGVRPEEAAGHQQAMAWFEAERYVLPAAVTLASDSGFDIHAWQIPWAMWYFLDRQGRWHEHAALQRTATAVATRLGDLAGQAVSHRLLAITCTRLGEYAEAGTHQAMCLELCRQLGDRAGEARAHQTLLWITEHQHRYDDALSHAEQALRLFRAIGHQHGQAEALNGVGWINALLGNYQQAQFSCRQALTLYRDTGCRSGEAYTWDSLGYATHKLGHIAQAAHYYQRALSLFTELGDRYGEADTLGRLGDARQTAGDLRQAREAWQQARCILDDLRHPDADLIRAKLAGTVSSGR